METLIPKRAAVDGIPKRFFFGMAIESPMAIFRSVAEIPVDAPHFVGIGMPLSISNSIMRRLLPIPPRLLSIIS